MWTGQKVRLRALEEDDLPLTQRWTNAPSVVEFEGYPFPVSMADERTWFGVVRQSDFRKVLIIEVLEEKRPIGNIYFDVDWRHRSASISITVGEPQEHGKGYGTDAIVTAVSHAFDELGLIRVSAAILAFNTGSLRAFEKAGFRQEGVRRQSFIWHGVPHDQVMMSILREEYQSQRLREK